MARGRALGAICIASIASTWWACQCLSTDCATRTRFILLYLVYMNNQSFIVKLIIKAGLAKDEKSAQPVMIAIAVLAFVVMFIFWPR